MLAQSGTELVVRIERLIAAPPERIHAVLASFEGLRDWLGARVFEPHVGGRVLFDAEHEGQRWIMFGTVQRLNSSELAFTWCEVDTAARTVWPADTLVRVTLEPRDGGTLVALVHSGFEALPDAQEQFRGYEEGWASLNDLEKLARMCEAG